MILSFSLKSYVVLIPVFFVLLAVTAFGAAPGAISGKDGARMVLVPEGDFYMGSKGERYPQEEQPRHEIFVDGFYIDSHEVTNEMYARFLNERKPREGKDGKRWKWVVIRNDLDTPERSEWYSTEIRFDGERYKAMESFENYPVMSVSWFGAKEYCMWFGKRLPTEAEWEKAARGGLENKDFPWGDTMPTPESGVVFDQTWEENTMPPPTGEADTYPPNRLGIFGMAGNVAEWNDDWFDPLFYKDSPSKNPQGAVRDFGKNVRGGSWSSPAMGIRVGVRGFENPRSMPNGVGFRCVLSNDGGK